MQRKTEQQIPVPLRCTVACGQRRAGGAMDYSKTPPEPCATRKTRPPITYWPRACSRARFGNACWRGVGCQHLRPTVDSSLVDRWPQARRAVPESFRHGFDSLVLLVSWEVWKERNRQTFDKNSKTPAQVLALISEEADS
jgi:hypothetical protein